MEQVDNAWLVEQLEVPKLFGKLRNYQAGRDKQERNKWS
jgi:hypothetical protein